MITKNIFEWRQFTTFPKGTDLLLINKRLLEFVLRLMLDVYFFPFDGCFWKQNFIYVLENKYVGIIQIYMLFLTMHCKDVVSLLSNLTLRQSRNKHTLKIMEKYIYNIWLSHIQPA